MTDGIAVLRCGNASGDCQVVGGGNAEGQLENVGGDCKLNGAARLNVSSVGSDCRVQGNVGSDLSVVGAARVASGTIGGDCKLNDVQGTVTLGHIGGDANFRVRAVDGAVEHSPLVVVERPRSAGPVARATQHDLEQAQERRHALGERILIGTILVGTNLRRRRW